MLEKSPNQYYYTLKTIIMHLSSIIPFLAKHEGVIPLFLLFTLCLIGALLTLRKIKQGKYTMSQEDRDMFKVIQEETLTIPTFYPNKGLQDYMQRNINNPTYEKSAFPKPPTRLEQINLIQQAMYTAAELGIFLDLLGIPNPHPLQENITTINLTLNYLKEYLQENSVYSPEPESQKSVINYTYYLLMQLNQKNKVPYNPNKIYFAQFHQNKEWDKEMQSNGIMQRYINVKESIKEREERDRINKIMQRERDKNAFDDFLKNAEGPPQDLRDNLNQKQKREHWEDEENNS